MKPILILGGAKCVWKDAESLGEWIHPVAAVNDVGAQWKGKLLFWASLHPRKFQIWERQRQRNNYPAGYVKYGNKHGKPLIDYLVQDWGGSSGLFAVKIALSLGFDKIILAGVPMEAAEGHFFDKKEWTACNQYRAAWERHLKDIQPYVRSCSGWTKRLLGGPDLP